MTFAKQTAGHAVDAMADIEPRAVTLHLTAYEAYLLDAAAVTGYRALRDEAAPRAREVFPGVLDRLARERATAQELDALIASQASPDTKD